MLVDNIAPMHEAPSNPAIAAVKSALILQRNAFSKDPFPELSTRKADLTNLEKILVARHDDIVKALQDDFGGRCRQEALLSEVVVTLNNLRYTRRNLRQWMKPRKRNVPFVLGMGKASVLPQPLGVIGIVSPWNFPTQLSLVPLIAALAAGNRAMIKPSELSPASSALLNSLISEIFDADKVAVFQGDVAVAQSFVALPFDHLIYTGSTEVGRHVMRSAAENLVPITLELGGKSPALVAPDANLMESVKDIIFGKLTNAGQICIAPDYALVPRAQLNNFTAACQTIARQMYPEGTSSNDYTSIINDRHLARLRGYLSDAQESGIELLSLFAEGKTPAVSRKLAPMLALNPPQNSALMRNEIFGPILPVIPYDSLDDAINFINARPRPLALYLFTSSRETADRVTRLTVSGGIAINDTLTHCAVEDLPFGGVGASGIGHYHGPEGFETLSKMKPIFHRKGIRTDQFPRPPYTNLKTRLIEWLL